MAHLPISVAHRLDQTAANHGPLDRAPNLRPNQAGPADVAGFRWAQSPRMGSAFSWQKDQQFASDKFQLQSPKMAGIFKTMNIAVQEGDLQAVESMAKSGNDVNVCISLRFLLLSFKSSLCILFFFSSFHYFLIVDSICMWKNFLFFQTWLIVSFFSINLACFLFNSVTCMLRPPQR
ncbi:MAG: hypothetical protein Q8P67_21875 [archaeon]|nr:hypothetical protein [archaeon]